LIVRASTSLDGKSISRSTRRMWENLRSFLPDLDPSQSLLRLRHRMPTEYLRAKTKNSPPSSHNLKPLQMRSVRCKALCHLQLTWLYTMPNISQIRSTTNHLGHRWSMLLLTKHKLFQCLGHGLSSSELAHQVHSPWRVTNVFFVADVCF
jgi:hypothetical protein